MTIKITPTGKAVAKAGIHPEAAIDMLVFLNLKADDLVELNKRCAESELDDADDIAFVLIHTAFSSEEYSSGANQRKFIPYQLVAQPLTGPQGRTRPYLTGSSPVEATNAAVLAWRWIRGAETKQLEAALDVRSGVLLGMFRDAASILRGMADVLFAATSIRSEGQRPAGLDQGKIEGLKQLVGTMRLVAIRLEVGLPDDVVWMRSLCAGGANMPAQRNRASLLTRKQIMDLRSRGMVSPSNILDTGRFPELLDGVGPRTPANTQVAQAVQHATRTWRNEERNRLVESQTKRLPVECRDILLRFYRERETACEHVLEEVFECFDINVSAKDDGSLPAFPDFILDFMNPKDFALECKSKTVGDSVTLNDATEVIRKAGVNGYNLSFKVTVCQPYVSPEVPRALVNCPDLCVVNAEDLAEAFVRLKTGKLDKQGFADWLGRPGQALREHLSNAT